MIHIPLWKTILTVVVCILGILFFSHKFFTSDKLNHFNILFTKRQVVLCRDIKVGAHLLLEVDFEAVVKEQMHTLADTVRSTFRKDLI